ncbi:hypothetical protein, partial [Acinetobacter baumannii]|uniref:hypothetical protein n=4 Tax=Acinetobacter baumannii TaxID=470 RepID=UPI001D173609
ITYNKLLIGGFVMGSTVRLRDPTAKLVIDTALDMQQEQRQMVKTSDIVETLVQRYINTISFEDVQQTIENRKKNKKSKDK